MLEKYSSLDIKKAEHQPETKYICGLMFYLSENRGREI